MHEKLLKAVEKGATSNQEENAAQEIVSRARSAACRWSMRRSSRRAPCWSPSSRTSPIYWQEGARRRHLKDEPEYDRVADYQSSNDAYVIEDFGAAALVENIEAMTYPAPTEA